MVSCACPDGGHETENVMTQKTCAACDSPLDGDVVEVKIGGRTVEACCEECARKLRETGARS